MIKVLVPRTNESILSCTIGKCLKRAGDVVVRNEPLFEISGEKGNFQVLCPASGILSKILVFVGQTVGIGTVLALIKEIDNDEIEDPEIQQQMSFSEEQVPAKGAQDKMESLSVSSQSYNIHEPSPPDLNLRAIAFAEPCIQIREKRTSPLVRRIAMENHIDLSEISGTGWLGRITKDDILRYLGQKEEARAILLEGATAIEMESRETGSAAAYTVEVVTGEESTDKQMEGRQRSLETMATKIKKEPVTPAPSAFAEYWIAGQQGMLPVSIFFEVDMSAIVQLRQSKKVEFMKQEGIPLTYTAFFAKALIEAVQESPILGALVSDEGAVSGRSVNLAIAMVTDNGLVMPVIVDAHLRSFTGLAHAIYELAERVKNKQLVQDDLKDAAVGLANLGGYGGLFATPIFHPPQVAIIGFGRIEKRPVIVHDAIAIRPMVYLSLTFDPRAINGAVADQFMARIKDKLQSWTRWVD